MDDITTWTPIPGYPGYEASTDGQIAHWRTAGRKTYRRPLGASSLKSGHMLVSVKDADGNAQRRYIHRLVLTAFVGEPEPGMYACHYDDNPANNHLDNLRWDTPAGNGRDHARTSRTGKTLKVHPIEVSAHWDDETVTQAERHNALLDQIHNLTQQRTDLIAELDTIRGHFNMTSRDRRPPDFYAV